jgi:subtilase family serine protease
MGALTLMTVTVLVATPALAAARHQRSACPKRAVPTNARCHAEVTTDAHGTPTAAPAPPPSWYGPAQLHGAYNLPDATAAGTPQTIAIVDAYNDPRITDDLRAYDEAYGLPAFPTCRALSSFEACFAKVNQRGQLKHYPGADSEWDLEISLDVETAHEICQDCRILLVEAHNEAPANLNAAEQTAAALGASVIANSWGTESEYPEETSENAYFDHPGVAVVAASGDGGYESFGFPAASPDVIAAGGTTLGLVEAEGRYSWSSEETWGAGELSSALGGSGSGCSLFFSAPSWQTSLANWSATGCGSDRGVADLAADANPETGAAVYDSVGYEGVRGWLQVGGTSLSAQIIGGVYGLAGNAASTPYPAALAYASLGGGTLHDIASGPSTGTCGTIMCIADESYDGPSGVGTPNGIGAF